MMEEGHGGTAGYSPRKASGLFPDSGAKAPRGLKSAVRTVVVLCLICALGAFGQQKKKAAAPPPAPVEAPTVFPLETLKIRGNKRIPADKIIAAAGMKIGVP